MRSIPLHNVWDETHDQFRGTTQITHAFVENTGHFEAR